MNKIIIANLVPKKFRGMTKNSEECGGFALLRPGFALLRPPPEKIWRRLKKNLENICTPLGMYTAPPLK
jgi:hypothetical protein